MASKTEESTQFAALSYRVGVDGRPGVPLFTSREPEVLLREAKRVAKITIVPKDHTLDGIWAGATFRFMDWAENAHRGVVLRYNHWRESRWLGTFRSISRHVQYWRQRLSLYPMPASWLFDHRLHFVARLGV